jgi:hypothetical protein
VSVYISQVTSLLLNFMECIIIHCADPVDMRILATRRDSMYRTHILKCPEVSLFLARQPPMGQGLLVHEICRSQHNNVQQSLGLLRTSDQLVAETSLPDNTQHLQQTNIHAPDGEPTISAGERPQTYALDRSAAGTGPEVSGHFILLSSVMLQLEVVPLRV